MRSFNSPVRSGIIGRDSIPYFFSNQAMAALYTLALSVTISLTHPHLQMMSSNNQIPMDLPISSLKGRPSIQEVIPQRPCAMCLHPFDFGVILIVSVCNL